MVHPVKIAFHVDIASHVDIAEIAIAAARKAMPDAEIWHLTTLDGPTLSADKCLRIDAPGGFGERRGILGAAMTGDVLYLDADVILREDVSNVFADEFDVCLATDMRPGAEGIKYNHGVIFCRSQRYWDAVAKACKGIDFGKVPGDWENIERTMAGVFDSGEFKTKVLPGNEYNYVPARAGDVQGKAVHYRGARKSWMMPVTGFETGLNTSMDTMIEQSIENLRRDIPMFVEMEANKGEAMIIGGGPSIADQLSCIRLHKARGGVIFALNGVHDWLINKGIVPDFHVMLDARQENADFVQTPHKSVTYLISAQCNTAVFDALKGFHVVCWVACTDTPENDRKICEKYPNKPIIMVGGGATVGLKTMNLAYLLGFRKIALYGLDSSYKGDDNHAYRQPLNDKESRITIHAAGRDFICAPWMAKQAMEFQGQYRQLVGLGCKINVYGDGLLPHVANQLKETANV